MLFIASLYLRHLKKCSFAKQPVQELLMLSKLSLFSIITSMLEALLWSDLMVEMEQFV